MIYTKAPAASPIAERRKEKRRVNFLLEENGWFGRGFDGQGGQDPWSCTRRTGSRSGRWDAFEEWQRQAKQAQAKTIDGVSRLPRKLSLKAIFRGG
jgi:hypothetical protein